MAYGTSTYGGAAYASTSAPTITDTPPAVPGSGWHVVVTHPTTDRRIIPDVLGDPAILPSLNSLPEVRIPVRSSEVWLDPAMDDNPAMNVYLDGNRQPIDELREVEDEVGRTVLVGVGGVELDQRATAEFTSEQRHDAASSIITSNTTYTADVDTPNVDSKTDESVQSVTTTGEFETNIAYADTDPVDTSGDEVKPHQTAHFLDPQSDFDTRQYFGPLSDSTAQGGEYVQLSQTGDFVEYKVTFDYDIPEYDFSGTFTAGIDEDLRGREEVDNNLPAFDIIIDGQTVVSTNVDDNVGLEPNTWEWMQGSGFGNGDPDPYP